jgi:hypothetical protein
MNDLRGWIKDVGFPIAVSVWLIFYITPMVVKTAEGMTRHLSDSEVTIVLLRAICRNGAKSELQAQFCDYGLPKWTDRR